MNRLARQGSQSFGWQQLTAAVDRYTSTTLLGLDAGSAVVKLVELTPPGAPLALRRCLIADADSTDPRGALRRLLNGNDLSQARVVIGLASPELIVKSVSFPPMPPKELQSALRLEPVMHFGSTT